MIYYVFQHLKVKNSQLTRFITLEIDQERYSIGTTKKIESENTRAPTDVPHKLFELFLVNEVINHLCKQSKIYTNSK